MLFENRLTKVTAYLFLLLPICMFISIAVGNVALGLASACWLVFVVLKLHQTKDYSFVSLVPNKDSRDYLCVYAVWAGALLLSGLLCEHPLDGFKEWAEWCVWRFMPFVFLAMLPIDGKYIKRMLLVVFACMTIVDVVMVYQGIVTGHRIGSWNGTPMTLAGQLCILLPAMLVAYYDDKVFGKWAKFFGFAFLLGLFALVVNNTRGAWMGVGVACVVVVSQYAFRSKKQLAILGVVLCLFGGLFVAKPQLLSRWTTNPNDYSTITRIRMWTAAYNMWKDHPVLGVGLSQYKGNYQNKYILKTAGADEKKFGHAHSNIMCMLAENGAVGLFAFLFCFGYILVRSWKDWKKYKNPYALMIFAGTLALMIQGLTERNIGNSVVMKLYWLFFGVCLRLQGFCDNEKMSVENVKNGYLGQCFDNGKICSPLGTDPLGLNKFI